jgi:serine phosphatase RsbU (regulator of sigma subunit)
MVGRQGHADDLLGELTAQLEKHTDGYDQHDDITVLCLHRQSLK